MDVKTLLSQSQCRATGRYSYTELHVLSPQLCAFSTSLTKMSFVSWILLLAISVFMLIDLARSQISSTHWKSWQRRTLLLLRIPSTFSFIIILLLKLSCSAWIWWDLEQGKGDIDWKTTFCRIIIGQALKYYIMSHGDLFKD